tara:strand:- start:407 stop:1087 length:681 start_codon:yes stop_codon:yes gene_type:complete
MPNKADKWKPDAAVLQKRAAEAALQFLDFEDRYQRALFEWVSDLGYLPEGDFWQLQETLLQDFIRVGCDVDLVAEEFVRRPIEADYEGDGYSVTQYTFEDALRFVLTWSMKTSMAYASLWNLVDEDPEEMEGGKLHDMVDRMSDGIPLLGRELYERIVSGKLSSVTEIPVSETIQKIVKDCKVGDEYLAALHESAIGDGRFNTFLRRSVSFGFSYWIAVGLPEATQ